MYEIVETIFKKVKSSNSNIKCYLGGAISIKSKEFIKKLFEKNLIDKFETRYIIFDVKKINVEDLSRILQTFNRYNYLVKASFQNSDFSGDMKNKFDEFLHFINI